MRVIAGEARSLPLKTPQGLDTRPTTDRIKETLFNMLQPYLPCSVFIDLCSGSGGSRDGNVEPWFCAAKDLKRNVLVVVQGHDDPLLLSSGLSAVHCSWTAGCAPETDAPVSVKTRYRAPDGSCLLLAADTKIATCELAFPDPQWAATPGQSAVLYSGDVCLGGGFIETVLPVPAS